ncbi:MAG: glycosyltransferase family 2 protein [Pseudobdellovibrionaceae bacterium]
MELTPVRSPNLIACLILSFNKPEISRRCILSCLPHFNPENIFLIHNGSIEKHRKVLEKEFSEIQHLILDNNLGYSGGTQFGIEQIFKVQNYSLCFFITNDCELLNFPIHIFEEFNNKQNLFSGGILLRRDLEIECTFGAVNLYRGRLRHLKQLTDLGPQEQLYIPGHFFLISKATWNCLSGLNTKLHTYWEDVELSLQCHRKGIPLGYFPELQVKHAGGKTTRGNPFYSLYLYQRNRKKVSWLYTPSHLCFSFYFGYDFIRLLCKQILSRKFENLKYFWKILVD